MARFSAWLSGRRIFFVDAFAFDLADQPLQICIAQLLERVIAGLDDVLFQPAGSCSI